MKRIFCLISLVLGLSACGTEGEIIEGRSVSSIAPNSGAAGGNSPVVGGVYYDSTEGLSVSDSGETGDVLVMGVNKTPMWVLATPEAALPTAGGNMLGNIAMGGNYLSGDGDNEGLFVDTNGYIGVNTEVPTEALHVVGDAIKTQGGSTWKVASDERLKNDYGIYKKGLKEINELKIHEFSYKQDNKLNLPKETLEQGVFAQEMMDVFPEAIYSNRGYYFVNYHPINMALIKSVQDLSKENAKLKKRLDALEALVKARR